MMTVKNQVLEDKTFPETLYPPQMTHG